MTGAILLNGFDSVQIVLAELDLSLPCQGELIVQKIFQSMFMVISILVISVVDAIV